MVQLPIIKAIFMINRSSGKRSRERERRHWGDRVSWKLPLESRSMGVLPAIGLQLP